MHAAIRCDNPDLTLRSVRVVAVAQGMAARRARPRAGVLCRSLVIISDCGSTAVRSDGGWIGDVACLPRHDRRFRHLFGPFRRSTAALPLSRQLVSVHHHGYRYGLGVTTPARAALPLSVPVPARLDGRHPVQLNTVKLAAFSAALVTVTGMLTARLQWVSR